MFYLVQAGSALQIIKSDGTIASTLTLPSGVTVDSTRRAKSAVLGSNVVIVNSPTINLWLDPLTFTLRPMSLLPPLGPPDVAAGSATGLTGEYHWKCSFAIKDDSGLVINESALTLQSLAVTLADQKGALTNIPVSTDTNVNCRRIYRTAAGGTIFFRVFDIDDNFNTSIEDSVSDESTDRLPEEPTLGAPAGAMAGVRMRTIVTWKNYLWGVADRFDLIDRLLYCEDNQFYAWGPDNFFRIYPEGEDAFGIVGFLPRRDALGVLKRQLLTKVFGSSPDDFEVKTVVDKLGGIAGESCMVIRDVGYWLAEDGVYQWSDDGVECISREKVDAWFTTDTYFNRSKFPDAIGCFNNVENTYELQLAAAGSSNLDRWISFSIDKKEWLGPHKTAAFTPTARAMLRSDANVLRPVIAGSDGYLYLQNQTVPSDVAGSASAIDAILEPKWHHGKAPNVEHLFGNLSVLSRIETAGQQLTITPYVGGLDAAAGTAYTADLTLGRQRLGIIGPGRLARLQFRQNTVAQRFLLYGYEFPLHELGVR